MKTLEKDIRIMYKSSDVVNSTFKILIHIYIYIYNTHYISEQQLLVSLRNPFVQFVTVKYPSASKKNTGVKDQRGKKENKANKLNLIHQNTM